MSEETILLPLSIQPQRVVYEDRNQQIHHIIAQFDGFSKEYFVSDMGERSAVVAVQNEHILFVRQYRLLINGLSYEIPGGKVDDHETLEATAQRECFEETGVWCSNLKPLLDYQPSLDIWKNHTHIFYTEDTQELKKYSVNQTLWMPITDCISMIFSQQIIDSLSIIAVFAYQSLLRD